MVTSIQLHQFQGPGFVHAGSGSLGHLLHGAEPLLMLFVTPVIFLLKYAVSKFYVLYTALLGLVQWCNANIHFEVFVYHLS